VADLGLLRSFRFQVQLLSSAEAVVGEPAAGVPNASAAGAKLGQGAFQECTGLDIEMDVQEYLEGGRNDGVIRRIGRAKYQNLVLKRGMLWSPGGGVDRSLWVWIQEVVAGTRQQKRYDGIVQVMGIANDVVATWTFRRGLPAKVTGPQLNAKTGEVAIEELHIAHEGLQLGGA
jgi:phage tail-like protein